ncbi:PDDEXK family nuclease [Ollibium composti]|uniref:DUF91 domain-containing protein n=1 Tax=Ollibium composti TaxID=2675109 RepID=A0ABY2Q104_9HYPH|nr:hypothetical protein [Mesorhizobium composti]THF54385.1 hypothetical protein E6C48_22180 [Mesorhizobium composti]
MGDMGRSRATPVLVGNDNRRSQLEHVRLGNGLFDEDWLQELIHNHPSILPISEIEPGFGNLIAVAREVPCRHGFIDNLCVTASGDIVVIETKLWRNPQMRREVVAQLLDYVAALVTMTYDEFEMAISRGQSAPRNLFSLVRDDPEALDEAEFIDAIAHNLRRGRMVVIALGDGIRAETETLGNLLQSHAGSHFTFALVELATWKMPSGDILVVPDTLAKTVMIERGIVRVENGEPVVRPVPATLQSGPQSISSADFWEKMAERDPALPNAIRRFTEALKPLGVYTELRAGLNLKVDMADQTVNLGYILKNGQFWTERTPLRVPERAWRPYLETLADLVGGTVRLASGFGTYVSIGGKEAPRIEQLLPRHHDAFVSAIETMLRTLNSEDA